MSLLPLLVVPDPNLHTSTSPFLSPETHKSCTIGEIDNALISDEWPRKMRIHRLAVVSH